MNASGRAIKALHRIAAKCEFVIMKFLAREV